MEVILVKPVKKLGKIGEIVKVRNGFGRNYLIPQNFAIRATENNKKLIEQQKHELEEKNANAKTAAEALARLIVGKEISFIRQSADDGRLFGSVNNKEIAKELAKIAGQEIPYHHVVLEIPIKSTGLFQVGISLHAEVYSEILVIVARSESEALEALRSHKASQASGSNPEIG